jgi:anti-sigma factor RsiW
MRCNVHDHWFNRLSEWLDGDLPQADRDAIEAHVSECAECLNALEDLRRVQRAARQLPPRMPDRDLWPGIETRIEPRPMRRVSFSWPAAMAAGLFIAALSGLGTWVALHRGEAPVADLASVVEPRTAGARAIAVNSAPYDRAIADLLTTLRTERRDLNPRTIDTIERSLAVINKAIADAQDALAKDPTDDDLVAYLSERQRARLAVLRQVERIAPEAP